MVLSYTFKDFVGLGKMRCYTNGTGLGFVGCGFLCFANLTLSVIFEEPFLVLAVCWVWDF